MKARALPAVCLLAVLLSSCVKAGVEPSATVPGQTPRPTPRILDMARDVTGEALNDFSLRLLQQADEGERNVMMCTQSAGISLGMLRAGAAGNTAEQLDGALGFTGLSDTALLAFFKQLRMELQSVNGVGVELTQGLYVGEGPTVKESYCQDISAAFGAPVTLIDFSEPVTLDLINDWVGQVTEGRVDRLFEEIAAETSILLVDNAIFTGQWLRAFDPRATSPLPFMVEDGHPVVVSVMFGEAEAARYAGKDADCAFIPLDGGDAEAWILLPPEDQPLSAFVDTLTVQRMLDWRGQAVEQPWKLKIPRLNMTWTQDLAGILSAMGASDMLDGTIADLSAMGSGLSLTRAQHRTQFALEEPGSLPATITSPALSLQSSKDDPAIFNATRPFAIFIYCVETHAILFAGTLHNPLPT